MTGDSGHCMARLVPSDVQTYISTRARQGFNSVQFNLVATGYVGNSNANLATDDGITPFTSGTDITAPNETYWSRMDSYVQLCAQYGLLAILNPIESSTNTDQGGGYRYLSAAGTSGCTTFGQYVGKRYKNFSNVLWQLGNDYDDQTTTTHNIMTA